MIVCFRTTDDSASNRSTLLGQTGKIDLKLVVVLFPSSICSNSLVFDTPFPVPFCPPPPPTYLSHSGEPKKGKGDNLLLNSPDLMLNYLHM